MENRFNQPERPCLNTLNVTTKENSRLSKAIAPHHRDNGIEARPRHIPIGHPAIIHSFTNTMPVLRGHIESSFRCPHDGEYIYPDTLVEHAEAEIETETNCLWRSIETLPRTMPAYPSSSPSKIISSLTRSSSGILRNTRRRLSCPY